MSWLILGLVLFVGAHSLRIVAEGWRSRVIAQGGERAIKGGVAVASLAGIVLMSWGYGLARQTPWVLWDTPLWTRHVAGLLMLLALVLLFSAHVPRNAFKARLHHPMVLGVKVWALAHLLANNTAADLVLFGGLLLWSVFDFRAARQRDAAAGTRYPAGTLGGTLAALAVGTVVWAVFAFWAHNALFGVRPFGV